MEILGAAVLSVIGLVVVIALAIALAPYVLSILGWIIGIVAVIAVVALVVWFGVVICKDIAAIPTAWRERHERRAWKRQRKMYDKAFRR
jgi:hypothetical protein